MSELQRNDHINLCLMRSESVSSGKKGIRDYFGKPMEKVHHSVDEAPKSFYLISDPLDSVRIPRHSKHSPKVKSVAPTSLSRVSKSKSVALIPQPKTTTVQLKTAKSRSKTEIDVPNSILVVLSFLSYLAYPIPKGLFQRELDFNLLLITDAFRSHSGLEFFLQEREDLCYSYNMPFGREQVLASSLHICANGNRSTLLLDQCWE